MVAAAKLRRNQQRIESLRPYAIDMIEMMERPRDLLGGDAPVSRCCRHARGPHGRRRRHDRRPRPRRRLQRQRGAQGHGDRARPARAGQSRRACSPSGRKGIGTLKFRGCRLEKTWQGLQRPARSTRDAQEIAADAHRHVHERRGRPRAAHLQPLHVADRADAHGRRHPAGAQGGRHRRRRARRRSPTSTSRTPEDILEGLLPAYVEIAVYRALLESSASEQGARMTAMRNASDSAEEMIDSAHAGAQPRPPGGHHAGDPRGRGRRRGPRLMPAVTGRRTATTLQASGVDAMNKGTVVQVIGAVIDVRFPDEIPAIYNALKVRIDSGDGHTRAGRRGAAAPRRRQGAGRRHGLHRRPRARHRGRRHRRAHDGAGRRGDAGPPHQRHRRHHRQRRSARRRSSTGPSTGRRPPSRSSTPRTRSSRPASRSSTCSPRTSRAARSASSAAPAWARPSSSRSSSTTSPPQHGGLSVFCGVGERTREGNDLWTEMKESGVIDKTALVFGQMNEPPGARLRVGLAGLTVAEYFRDVRRPGRAPVHRQHLPLRAGGLRGLGAARPHAERRGLPAHAGHRDGRAAGAHHLHQARLGHLGAGHLRAGRRPHRPGAGDHLRPPRRHHGALAAPSSEKGIYPAVDPLDSTSRILDPRRRGRRALRGRHARAGDPAALQGPPGHHRHPRHGRALRRGQGRRAARPQDRALPLAAVLRGRAFTGIAGQVRAARETVRGFKEIVEGKCDDLPEQAFFMVGGIEEAGRAGQDARAAHEAAERLRRGGRATALHVEVVTPDGAGLRRRRRDGRPARRRRRARHPAAAPAPRHAARHRRDARPQGRRRAGTTSPPASATPQVLFDKVLVVVDHGELAGAIDVRARRGGARSAPGSACRRAATWARRPRSTTSVPSRR